MRGSQDLTDLEDMDERSIPAGAGEPALMRLVFPPARVYPRGCGGACIAACEIIRVGGLSPRVRGSQPRRKACKVARRSIPAGAGEPASSTPSTPTGGVYPRGCGGAGDDISPPSSTNGLSPRVRGASHYRMTPFIAWGLSPRVRGSRIKHSRHIPYPRSIPAGAGSRFVIALTSLVVWSIPAGAGEPY